MTVLSSVFRGDQVMHLMPESCMAERTANRTIPAMGIFTKKRNRKHGATVSGASGAGYRSCSPDRIVIPADSGLARTGSGITMETGIFHKDFAVWKIDDIKPGFTDSSYCWRLQTVGSVQIPAAFRLSERFDTACFIVVPVDHFRKFVIGRASGILIFSCADTGPDVSGPCLGLRFSGKEPEQIGVPCAGSVQTVNRHVL